MVDVFRKGKFELLALTEMKLKLKFLVNARALQLECARALHEPLLMPVLLQGSETMI